MRKKILLALSFLLIPTLLIGGGFAIFVFKNVETKETKMVNIKIEKAQDYGEMRLVYLDEGTYKDELEEISLKTHLELSYESVNLLRNDNPTKKRDFIIEYTSPLTYENGPLALYLKLTIKDNDARGVNLIGIAGEEIPYPKSSSLLDIITPKQVTNLDNDSSSSFIETLDNVDNIIYTSKILEFTPAGGEIVNYHSFSIDFKYSRYAGNYNSRTYSGSFSPAYFHSEEMLKEKMKSNIEAINNSSIDISFYLAKV